MANLRDIRRRITGVKSTQKITRAMRMVAASKLRRAQQVIVQARPYAYQMRELVENLARRAELEAHPLLKPGTGGTVELVVITSDRGLCGGFNSNIVKAALGHMRDNFRDRAVRLTVIGRRGADVLRRRECTIRDTVTGADEQNSLKTAGEVIDELIEGYLNGETAEVHCVYNEFKSAVQQDVTLERLLPFLAREEREAEEKPLDYLYEPSMNAVFEELLRKHLQVQLHRMLHESFASEYGARMTAMDAATRNAGEMIDNLTLEYNRVRQGAITTELIEVVSGAEAL